MSNEKNWSPGRWWLDRPFDEWRYSEAGYYDAGVVRPATIALPGDATRQLITALDEAGWIVPRLDERLREEDLKITHRLIDLLERRK